MEAVLAHLRRLIERGEYAVGGKLPSEAALSREFEVSRSVVREALRGLQALGMTESKTGKGTFVTATGPADNPTFGPYSARDLIEVRRHVEIPVAGYAALRRDQDDLDLLAHLRRADGRRDRQHRLGRARLALPHHHRPGLGQPRLREGDRGDPGRARPPVRLPQPARRPAPQSNVEHRAIVTAIESGSEADAVAAMTAHLTHVENTLTSIVNGDQ